MARRRWTAAQIIAEIRDLYTAGEPLTVANMRRLGYGGMVAAAYRQPSLGSWRAAVAAAGLAYAQAAPRQRKWTRQRIIAAIRQRYVQSEDLSYSHIKRSQPYLLAAARAPRNFGSWRAAIEAAGLDYRWVVHRGRATPAGRQEEGPAEAK